MSYVWKFRAAMCPSVWQLRQQEAEQFIRRAVVVVGVALGEGGHGGHMPLPMFLYLRIGFFFWPEGL